MSFWGLFQEEIAQGRLQQRQRVVTRGYRARNGNETLIYHKPVTAAPDPN